MAKSLFQSLYKAVLPVCALLALFELAARMSTATLRVVASLNLGLPGQELLSSVVAFGVVNAPLMLAERLWPGTKSERRYLDGAKFWLVYLVVTYGWSKIAVILSASLQLKPFLAWSVTSQSNPAAIAVATLLSLFAFDFFYYWFHRAQHHFAWAWRFHSVHHSIVHLNCLNSYHHVLEETFRFPFITVPLALLLKIDAPQLVLLSAFVGTWGQYIHSDTRVHFGALHRVFADNAYHRIHHSTQKRHFDKNFAAFFSVWDTLFGTYEAPERFALERVGLADVPPPRRILDYLIMPFRRAGRLDPAEIPTHGTATRL